MLASRPAGKYSLAIGSIRSWPTTSKASLSIHIGHVVADAALRADDFPPVGRCQVGRSAPPAPRLRNSTGALAEKGGARRNAHPAPPSEALRHFDADGPWRIVEAGINEAERSQD